tara:strand:- start:596 stop:1447 length:852 start_codon:yes stop_codon:yes gene_type:complete
MARILDKSTRLIDVDFGIVNVALNRILGRTSLDGTAGNQATYGGNGTQQIIRTKPGSPFGGSFVQYNRVDLSYMTQNNEVMQPTNVSVQRTTSSPISDHQNGNNYEPIEEYIFVLSRPLNNNEIETVPNPFSLFENIGLDMGADEFGGRDAGGVKHAQCIYAEKRIYTFSNEFAASQANGQLVDQNVILNSIFSGMRLSDVNTWGTMTSITGPNLHVYRVVNIKAQEFPSADFTNVAFGGQTTINMPPVNITFLCSDPKLTEGEYLTRLANAMNSIPIGGPTA